MKSIHPPWPIWLEGDTEPIRLCLEQIWCSQSCEVVVQQGESHLISITGQIVTISCIVCCACVSRKVNGLQSNVGVLNGQSSDTPMWFRHLKHLLWFLKQLFMTALVWWFPMTDVVEFATTQFILYLNKRFCSPGLKSWITYLNISSSLLIHGQHATSVVLHYRWCTIQWFEGFKLKKILQRLLNFWSTEMAHGHWILTDTDTTSNSQTLCVCPQSCIFFLSPATLLQWKYNYS